LEQRSADKLLALLVLWRGREVPKKALHDRLWPDHEGTYDTPYGPADKSVQHLYRTVGRDCFERVRRGKDWHWSIDSNRLWADTWVVEEAVSGGNTTKLQEALSLCHGTLLESWVDEQWAKEEADVWLRNQLKRAQRRLNAAVEPHMVDALSSLATTLGHMQQPREIIFHRDLLACLDASRKKSRSQNVPFRTPNLLLTLFDMPNSLTLKAFTSVRSGFATELVQTLRDFVARTQVPVDRETGRWFAAVEWSQHECVQIAAEEARNDKCPLVMEKHLLLGVLQSSSSRTVEWLRAKLGTKDFARLICVVRGDQGTPISEDYPLANHDAGRGPRN
jgi:hypothetical protein